MPAHHERQSEAKDTSPGTRRRSSSPGETPDLARFSRSDAAGLQHLAGNRAVSHLVAQRRAALQEQSTVEEVTPEQIGAVTRGGGKPLDEPILQRAEGATGMDMSHVRVHTGPEAAASAAALRARAYTVGSDIVVGSGGSDPETLLHEAKHVEQQARGAVPGQATSGGLHLSHPGDTAEREAASFAAAEMRKPAPDPGAALELHHPEDGHGHAAVQRVAQTGESSTAGDAFGEEEIETIPAAGEPVSSGRPVSPEGLRDPRHKLSNDITANTLVQPGKAGLWDYVARKWSDIVYSRERTRLRDALGRRVIKGKPFSGRELTLIQQLSGEDPDWLRTIGIGTYEEAEALAGGRHPDRFRTWMQMAPGTRILAATIAFNTQRPAPGQRAPINPAYTLGRFMTTQGLKPGDEGRAPLEQERDAQIRDTAVDTLYPPESAGAVPDAARTKAAAANVILTNVLQVLQAGLQVRNDGGGYRNYEGDVIRALAHGGRVNIRIPALTGTARPDDLLEYLGVLQGGKRSSVVDRRSGATHYTDIGENKAGQPGRFVEKGGGLAGARNVAVNGPGYLGEKITGGLLNKAATDRGATELMGIDIAAGGVGTTDWNGDVVLPNGSYGHMLLVWSPPTARKDGSLLVGIETVAMGADSPVGYVHGMTSTEATANPESVLHGHKADKIGEGKTKDNTRLVELAQVRDGDKGWLEVLTDMRDNWQERLRDAEDKRPLYEELVGPRATG
ncbi:eCIS core domain-containing protein [Symbioplanes lichenis]|uniref:eCIS core domain-containing protein n=1 Tax=Symbioplanes lichenis TaxID=1629072 RepID=UPI002738B143|nr:DUF4157 domain-containing protein [Actinoplanes lichenis]